MKSRVILKENDYYCFVCNRKHSPGEAKFLTHVSSNGLEQDKIKKLVLVSGTKKKVTIQDRHSDDHNN